MPRWAHPTTCQLLELENGLEWVHDLGPYNLHRISNFRFFLDQENWTRKQTGTWLDNPLGQHLTNLAFYLVLLYMGVTVRMHVDRVGTILQNDGMIGASLVWGGGGNLLGSSNTSLCWSRI